MFIDLLISRHGTLPGTKRRSGLTSCQATGFNCFLIQVIKRLVVSGTYLPHFLIYCSGLGKGGLAGSLSSEKVGLTHDTHEFVLRDLAITITISLVNHFLKLFICHAFTELFCDTFKIFERDLTFGRNNLLE